MAEPVETTNTNGRAAGERVAEVPRLALRPAEAAQALGISPRALWTMTRDETSGIPHVHLGRAVIYPVRELEQWLADQSGPKKTKKPAALRP